MSREPGRGPMPFPLLPFPRREFLRRSVLAGAGILALPSLRALGANVDADRWSLLSDTHIAADPATIAREINMADHLRAAVAEVRGLGPAPAGLFVNGDCSLDYGPFED